MLDWAIFGEDASNSFVSNEHDFRMAFSVFDVDHSSEPLSQAALGFSKYWPYGGIISSRPGKDLAFLKPGEAPRGLHPR